MKAAREQLGSDIGSAGLFCAVKGTGCCRQAAWRLENQVAPAAVTYKVDGVLVGYENPGSVSDVFEVCLVKYLVASAYWR